MRTDDIERLGSVATERYAPPKAAAAPEQPPRRPGAAGLILYLAFSASFIAAALETFPLGGTLASDTFILGGIAGAYTSGRYYRSRWLGFGVGLSVTFLAIGLAIYLRHAIGMA